MKNSCQEPSKCSGLLSMVLTSVIPHCEGLDHLCFMCTLNLAALYIGSCKSLCFISGHMTSARVVYILVNYFKLSIAPVMHGIFMSGNCYRNNG